MRPVGIEPFEREPSFVYFFGKVTKSTNEVSKNENDYNDGNQVGNEFDDAVKHGFYRRQHIAKQNAGDTPSYRKNAERQYDSLIQRQEDNQVSRYFEQEEDEADCLFLSLIACTTLL